MESLWERTSERTGFERLDRNVKTDVLIIGGGMAGVLCAYLFHQAGVPYVLAEAETVCSGITKNTTAKITCQHGLIFTNCCADSARSGRDSISRPTGRRWTGTGNCSGR